MKIYITLGCEPAPEGFERKHIIDLAEIQSSSVDEIIANHVLDKLKHPIHFFEEVQRILKPEGFMSAQNFYFRNPMAVAHPEVVRPLSEYSFTWCSKEWREANLWAAPATEVNLSVDYGLSVDPSYETRSDEVKAFAQANYAGAISAVHFKFTKK